ncbi:MAG TPA: IS1595 family transposase [Candidatus Saccharimonadales bacterium]
MHRSTSSLQTWFLAIYFFSTCKNNIAAKELQRHTGVTYKTAWRMGKQIRMSMKQDTKKLTGIVEADETWVGGRRRSTSLPWNKRPVLLGVVERGGRVSIEVVDSATATTAVPFVRKHVEKGSVLNTDESGIYHRTEKDYDRKTVVHSRREYVREDVYSNTIEGVWGLLKPSWAGTHRSVSRKYMQLYANEFCFRYNHRDEQIFPLLLEAVAQPVEVKP